MSRDKQLQAVDRQALQIKQVQDMAMNMSEFALVADISHCKAREWFRQEGFPSMGGLVFWSDFVLWRRQKFGLRNPIETVPMLAPEPSQPERAPRPSHKSQTKWTGRAAQILADFDK